MSGFGNVFAGFQEAAAQHATQLFQMQQQSHQDTANIFAKMAENEQLPPESRAWLYQGALAHANAANDPKTAKQYEYDPKANAITIPVQKLTQAPTPPPANIPGPNALSQSVGTGGTTVQSPTPPPTMQTAQQSPFQLMSPEEQVLRQQPLHEEAARAAGAQASAIAQGQESSKIREIEARNAIARYKNESDLAAKGYRPHYDAYGNQQGIEAIPDAELSATQKATILKAKAADELAKSKEELNRAEAAWNISRKDPNSPFNQRILAQLQLSQRRVAIAEAGLGLRTEEELARYHGVDMNGKDLPGAAHDPDTGQTVGTAFQRMYQPTAATLTKAQTALPVISQANDLIDFARDPANADLFGKVAGRWTDLMANKIGTEDKRMAVLAPKIRSLASLLAPLHGFRSQNAAQEFMQTMPIMDSPEAFAAAVKEYSNVAYRVNESGKPGAKPPAASAPTPPPTAPRAAAAGVTIDQIVSIKGQRRRVTAVYPDGRFDSEPVK
jgi:hypothetical protein